MGDAHDVDNDLRNELERDLRNFTANRVQKIDGIIVSGDIAFAGQPEEFAFGQAWVEKVAELANCSPSNIMMTPGNHDVDRKAIVAEVETLHGQICGANSLQERDDILAQILRNEDKGPLLMSSISAYNEMAKKYGCDVSAGAPFWERDFPLGNRGTLRIRGATSTLISGPNDHAVTHKVVYGGAQRTLMRADRVIRVLVGHHPPSWTLEGDDADKAFGDRAAVQLFGHKHESWYQRQRGIRVIYSISHGATRPVLSLTSQEYHIGNRALKFLSAELDPRSYYVRRLNLTSWSKALSTESAI